MTHIPQSSNATYNTNPYLSLPSKLSIADQYLAAADKKLFFSALNSAEQFTLFRSLNLPQRAELFAGLDAEKQTLFLINAVQDKVERAQLFERLPQEDQIHFFKHLVRSDLGNSFSVIKLSDAKGAAGLFLSLPPEGKNKYLLTATSEEKAHLCVHMQGFTEASAVLFAQLPYSDQLPIFRGLNGIHQRAFFKALTALENSTSNSLKPHDVTFKFRDAKAQVKLLAEVGFERGKELFYSATNRLEICKEMTPDQAVEYFNSFVKDKRSLEFRHGMYEAFSIKAKAAVIAQLKPVDRIDFLAQIAKDKYVASMFAHGQSPFTIAGATEFSRAMTGDRLTSTHKYSLIVDADSPALIKYKKCTAPDLASQRCLATTLVGARIDCIEETTPGGTIFSGKTKKECTVSLISPEFTETESRARDISFQIPGQASEFATFTNRNFPDLGDGVSIGKPLPEELASIALNPKAKGVTFKEGDGHENPGYKAKSSFVTKQAHSIFNPDQVDAGEYFAFDQLDQQDVGKTLEVNCARLITQGALESAHCQFEIKADDKSWGQRVTQSFDPKRGNLLGASTPEFTLSNYQALFNKFGIPTKGFMSNQGPILQYGDTPVQIETPVPPTTPPKADEGSWTSSNWMKMPSAERISKVFFLHLAPAAAGTFLAVKSAQFIKETAVDAKKTLGQKVAGIATMGVLGVAAGIAIAYERLSHLNLDMPQPTEA